jgi:hypothetical protein
VQFEVNLARFFSGKEPGVGLDRSWLCRAGKGDEVMLTRFGRTGEEAFRALVAGLESGRGK